MTKKPSEGLKAKGAETPDRPQEFGNEYAIGGSSDSSFSGVVNPASARPVSEEESDRPPTDLAEAERERGMLKLIHPIKLPLGLLSQTALLLKALEPNKDLIELFPSAYQLLCEEMNFLFGSNPRELGFVATHGRRWGPDEGFDFSKIPAVPELVFDPSPANLEASCKMLSSVFKGIKLAKKKKTLAEHVEDCHKAIHRAHEHRKALLRGRGVPDAYGVAEQSYEAFARGKFAFVGVQVGVLRDYLDRRSKRVQREKAEQRVLNRRKVKRSPERGKDSSKKSRKRFDSVCDRLVTSTPAF